MTNSSVTSIGAADSPARQAYMILRFGFTVATIIAGLDKFLHLLVNWDQYLPPIANQIVGGHGHQLMPSRSARSKLSPALA